MAADPCLFPRNEDDQVQELRRIANLNPQEFPLETMHRNLERAMRDAGMRVWEVPLLPVRTHSPCRWLKSACASAGCRPEHAADCWRCCCHQWWAGLHSVFGVEDLFLSILFWVLATSCVPLWLICGPHQPEVR